jgi:hypothetical protein
MSGIISKQIANKNILFYFDAANTKSYDGFGSTGYSLVLGTTASLLAGVTFSGDSFGAMAFNGTYSLAAAPYSVDSWITCGNRVSLLAPTFPITLEAWIKPTATGIASPVNQGVFSLDSPEQYPGNYWGAAIDITTNDGSDTFTISTGYFNGVSAGPDGRRSTLSVSRHVKAGEWSHIAAVIENSTTISIYYNGEVVPNTGLSGTATTMNWSGGIGKTTIGKSTGYYKYIFNGKVAMVRAYNATLTAASIKENYNLHATRFGLTKK